MRKHSLIINLLTCLLIAGPVDAQLPDHIYRSNIRSVKLFKNGDQTAFPILQLGTSEQLELHFDDMEGDIKNYYYTLQLCQADWTPANVQPFDYLRGFISNRIFTYRPSSMVQTRYTHYKTFLPERNGGPTKGGNYLLKVYLNDDTTRLAFTRRVLVVNKRVNVSGLVQQPFNGNLLQTHQRVQVGVTPLNMPMNAFSPNDIRVVLLQNDRWNTAKIINRPTLFQGNYYEYNDEEFSNFPAGQEWRWVDLRSFRLRSERVLRIVDSDTSARTDVYINPDKERGKQLYLYYRDINGHWMQENRDNPNPFLQGEYAWIHFTFIPPGNLPYQGKEVYVYGELTGYEVKEENRMIYDPAKGYYTKALFLKQGFYNYAYLTMDDRRREETPSLENTEGNYWGTENQYMVLVYFRPFGGRADELIGQTTLRSLFQR
ncbi:MAG: DUF5103 domain-containing protein [Chitinophagaceae bacterium]